MLCLAREARRNGGEYLRLPSTNKLFDGTASQRTNVDDNGTDDGTEGRTQEEGQRDGQRTDDDDDDDGDGTDEGTDGQMTTKEK